MYAVNSKNRQPKSKKPLLIVGVILLVLVGAAVAYRLTRKSPESLVIPNQNINESQETPEQQNETPSTTPPTSDKAIGNNEPPQPNTPPKEPSGAFVSNHRPSLGAQPSLTQEQSVCNTTPGAKCYIRFTKGSLSRTLPAKTTDSNGSAFWSWNVKDAQLTQGVWKITAFAELNGQTKSASDAINLEVQP